MDPDEMTAQTREKYCDKHDLIMFKNALGTFMCPFCASNVEVDNDG